MTEITIRKTFLDRRECVQSNLMLKNAREQEVSFFRVNLRSCYGQNLSFHLYTLY